jgi:VCBS repeat-containing protein
LVNSTNLDIQRDPAVAATDDGGFVVVWEARNQDNPGDFDFGVFGQRFSATATPLGGEFQVNAGNISATQFNPAVTGLPGGGFAVAFIDDLGDGSSDGIRARIYDTAGVPAAVDFQVNTTTSGNQVTPHIARIEPNGGANNLVNGGFVVTWSGTGDGSSNAVFAQIFQVDGTPVGTEFIVNTTTTGAQDEAEVAGLTGGRFVVVWDDDSGNDGSGTGVVARVFFGDGTPASAEIPVNVEFSSSQFDPSVVGLANGGFSVTWTSVNSGSAGDGNGNGVFTRSFDANGNPTTGEQQVNEQTSSTQDGSSLTQLSNGDFAAVWQSVTSGSAGDGSGGGIFLRLFGDNNTFVSPGAAPDVEAVSTVRVFDENTVNSTPQRIDADGAAAVSDSDSADFDGGRLIVTSLAQSVAEDDFPAQDADEQDQIGLDQTGGSPVSIAGADVSVNGTLVGTISSDGTNGTSLIIDLNANATAAEVELLVEHLTYQNSSDDPRPSTSLTILLEDGDGSTSAPVVVDIQITPESDTDGPVRGEVRVNTFQGNAQQVPAVATLFDSGTGLPNGYIAVWTSTNQANPGDGDRDIFAQRYDQNGLPVGSEFLVNQTLSFTQFEPSVAGLNDGGFVIAWRDDVGDASGDGIVMTRYDSSGNPIAGQTGVTVNTEFSSSQFQPDVIAHTDGGFQITWTSVNSGSAGDGSSNGVFTQRYNAAGATVGGETQVNVETDGAQDLPKTAALAAGRFVVVWQSDTNGTAGDGSSHGIFARLFDNAGVPEAGEFLVNSFTNGSQTDPQVAALSGGDFVVVWRSEGQDSSSGGIYGQRFTALGVAVGDEFRVNDTISGNQTTPAITALTDGKFVVSWVDTSTPAPGSGADVFAQVFDADGTRLDTEVRINTDVSGSQENPNMAALPDGNYVVVWESNAVDSDDVQQQIMGDPSEFLISDPPQLIGLPSTVTLPENATNAGTPVFEGNAIVLTDSDSADFNGGSLVISRIVSDVNAEDFQAPDDETQDNLSIGNTGGVVIAGTNVQFNGTSIGTLVGNGQGGADLQVDFNANSTPEAVEAVLRALEYENTSDNPRGSRTYSVEITDGDGSIQDPASFSIVVTQETDPGAAVPVGSELQVNTYSIGQQDQPEIAPLTDGGWVTIWQSDAQDGSGQGIYGQRFNADGSRNGPEFIVNTTTASAQQDPHVAALADGGWVVVWEGQNQDNGVDSDFGIIGQRYDSNGAAVGGEFVVNTTVSNTQFDAVVAGGATGSEFAVAWRTDTGDGSGDGIAYQRFDATGAPAGTELIVNEQVSSTQFAPAITYLSTGQILVAWVSVTSGAASDGSGNGVYGRVINTNGTFAGGEFQLNQQTSFDQDSVSVSATASGFVAAWQDNSGQDGSGTGIQARFFDNTGAGTTDEFTVNENRSSTQSTPDVTELSDGRILISWQSQQSPAGSGTDISGQLFTAAGVRIDGEFRVNTEISSTQANSTVAALPNGNFVIAWDSETSSTAGDGNLRGVFQQIFGDANDFGGLIADQIIGLPGQVTFDEADVNGGLVRLDPDKTAAVPDLGVANFNMGELTVAIASMNTNVDQFNAPDNLAQHQLGFIAGDVGNGDVTFSGTGVGDTVSVDGVVVGSITADGVNGGPLTVQFAATADQEAVEALLSGLGYSNTSDDPEAVRLSVNLSNGAGESTRTEFIDIGFTPEVDLGLTASDERIVNAHVNEIQREAEIVELNGGGFAVVWQSRNQDELANSYSEGVFAQVYDANHVPLGQEIQVNVFGPQAQQDPAIAATDDGGFVVVFEAQNQDNGADFDFGIVAQRYNADGTINGGQIVVNTTVVNTQFDPSVAALVGGGFVVSYTSDSGDGDVDAILSQRVDATGALLGEAVVNTTTAANQSQSDVATLVMGSNISAVPGYVIVWTDPSADGSSNSVRARLFDTDGTPRGADFQVNTTVASSQSNASVTGGIGSDGAGFVVIWEDNTNDGSSNGIFGQMYDASGAAVGTEFRVNDTTQSSQANPDVSALANGGFVVTWDGNGPGDGNGVYAQSYDASGNRVDSEVLVNQHISSTQATSSVTGLSGGGFAAVFDSTTSATAGDGSSTGIGLRVFEPLPGASTAPSLRQLDVSVILGANDVTAGPVVLDNGVHFSDPDNTDFDTGTLQVYYTRGPVATDQLSIEASGPITITGAGNDQVNFNGTQIGTIDGTSDGANGAELLITFNANATAHSVKAVVERVAFSSTDLAANIANTDRGVGFVITDGNGGQTEPDAIFLDINSGSVSNTGLMINDFGIIENGSQQSFGPVTESQVILSPVIVDVSIDFDDFLGVSFDTGFVRLEESGGSDPSQQLSVQDTGSGAGQIGFDGTNVSYEGTVIGTVDGTQNGQNGADLQINLNANAMPDSIEALMESFTFGLSGATSDFNPDLRLVVQNQAANQAVSAQVVLNITQDVVTVLPPTSQEEQVNTFSFDQQSSPRIANLTDGGYIVVWTSEQQDNPADTNGRGIFGQRYNEFGHEVGAEFQINDIPVGDQIQPRVTGLSNGGFAVLWTENGVARDGSGQSVFGHLYDAAGNSVNAGFQVNDQTSSTQNSGQVVDLDSGRFMTVWMSQTSGGAGDGSGTGIFGRTFDAAGVAEAAEFQINSTTATTQQRPRAITLDDGDVMVVWEDHSGADGSGQGVFAQRINSAGQLVSIDGGTLGADEIQVNTTSTGTQNRPDVAALAASSTLANGGFVVVWESPDASSTGVFAQVYDINGVAQGGEIQINLHTSSSQRDPVVFGTQDGGFIVQWTDDSGIDGSGSGVVAQLVNADGTLNGQPFIVNDEISSTQHRGEVTQLNNGTIVSVWASNTSAGAGDGNGEGVFQTLFNQPALPAGAMSPVLVGFETAADFDEGDVNAVFELIDPDGVISLTDMDSADFNGGSILVAPLVGSAGVFESQLGSSDGTAQDQIGLLDGNGVTVSGNNVMVGATTIGTIVQDGSNGGPLEIDLNGNAGPENVELVLTRLAYSNASDDPAPTRQYSVQISDGDGGSTGNNLITINVTPEADLLQVPVEGDQQVNTFTSGSQSASATATLYDSGTGNPNGFVTVWVSQDQDRVQDSGTGIFGQIYDLDGNPIGGEIQINAHTEFSQTAPSVTGLMGGGFAVGWQDDSFAHPAGIAGGDTDWAVIGQVFAADGSRVGSEFLINEETSSIQDQVNLSYLADGGFAATWTAPTSGGSGDTSGQAVAARTFNADGTARAGEFIVNQTTANNQFASQVAELSNGNLAFVWVSQIQDNAPTFDNGVFARITDHSGTNVVAEFQVNANVVNNQHVPSIVALDGGGFVIAWQDDSGIDGSGLGIYQQQYANDGTPDAAGNVRVNDVTFSSQSDPSLAALPGGGWIVTFSDSSGADGSGQGVLAQVFAADGSRIDGNFVVNSETSSTQSQSSAASTGNGDFVVSFTSFTSGSAGDGSSNGVFVRQFASTGSVAESSDPVVSGLPGTVVFDEADLNAGAEQLFPSLAVGDSDSADFNGGRLTLSIVQNDVIQTQFASPDDGDQDQLSIVPQAGSPITVVGGTDVQFNGTSIGTLISDGVNGADLTVTLNANATPLAVEALAESLGYANISDDPETARLLALTITDGDGGVFRETVNVTINPEVDGAVAVDEEVQTNSFIAGEQNDPDVATLFDPVSGNPNGYVATWTSFNQDATGDGQPGVFGQMYDASGAPVGGEFLVNTTTASAQQNSAVIGLSTGGFAVAWQSNAISGFDAFIQVYDQNGQKVGNEFHATDPGFAQGNVALASYNNGDFVLVREVQDDQSPFQNVIVGQRFDDAGGTVGLPFEIEAIGNEAFFDPAVAVLNDQKTVVVFTATNLDNPGDFSNGVFAQLYASDGSVIGVPQQLNVRERFSQDTPSVAATDDGGFVVAYKSDHNDDFGFTTSQGVYVQKFDTNGTPTTGEILVNEIVDSSQRNPDVIAQPGGGFVVSYSDDNGTDGSGAGVFAQTFDSNGNRIDGRMQLNEEFSSTQDGSALASLGGINYVAVWQSQTSAGAGDGSGNGIFHRLFGDPADFSVGGDPVVEGVNASVTYDENTLNGVPQLIDANGAAAISDPDSADFDGGSLLVSNVISSAPLIDQINPPDDLTQDVLGLRQDARVSISGVDVSVDAVIVGQIVQDGAAGQPFEILLNANATPEATEVLVEHLTYRNISDDPLPVRQLRIQLTDGDGAASDPVLVQVNITPTVDAAVPLGGENQANTTTVSDQDTPAVATLLNGDFIVVWQSQNQDGSAEGVFAQRIDPLGNHVAPDGTALPPAGIGEFQVNSTVVNSQFDAAVTGLPDGGFLISWTDNGSLDGSINGVFAQRFDANGVMVDPDGVTPSVAGSGEFQVNALTSSNQDQSDVAALEGANAGRWVQVWHSETSGGAGDGSGSAVIGQVFDTDGTLIGPAEFVVNTTTISEQDAPTVTALADGGFFVTWHSFSSGGSNDGSNFGIVGQRFDASFNPLGSELNINTLTASAQTFPRVETLNDGNLVVTWVDAVADGSSNGVFASIFMPDGTLVANQFRVNDQRISSQSEPDVTALDTGGFVITWSDNSGTDGSGVGVFAQQYDQNGNRLDSQFQVNTEFSSTQNQPVVTELPGGGFAIAWTSTSSSTAGDGSGNGVFYQIYNNDAPAVSPVSAVGDEDTPIILDESVFEAGFIDPNGQTLQAIRIDTLPTQGTITLNGSPITVGQEVTIAELIAGQLVYQGNQDFFGADQFLWTGSDGISFAPAAVQADVTVNPVNDPPGLEAGANATVAEGQLFQRVLTVTDPDADNRTISVDFDGDTIADQTFNSSSNSPTISHVFGPEGVFTVTVTVDDNAGQPNSVEMDTFTVTVQNAAPNAVNDFIQVSEDAADPPFDALFNDSDPGSDPFTLTLVNGGAFSTNVPILLSSGATVTVDTNGDFVYDPNGAFEGLASNQFGSDSFTYTIEDNGGLTDVGTVTVQIDGQNDNPTAADDTLAATSITPIVEDVFADNGNGADVDVDGDAFTVTQINGTTTDVGNSIVLPSGATVMLQSDGTLDYDPTTLTGSPSSDSFTYQITDTFGGTDTATVTININVSNLPPVAQNDDVSTDEDTAITAGDVFADNGNGIDNDSDGDPISIVAVNGNGSDVGNQVTLASGALLTLNSDGTFAYDPNNAFESTAVGAIDTDTFTYTISDGNGGTDQGTVTVTINGVNDNPVANAVHDNVVEDGPAVMGNMFINTTDVDDLTTFTIEQVAGSALSVGVLQNRPSGATVLIQANGDYTYDPAGGFQSLAEGATTQELISVLVGDGDGGSDLAFLVANLTGVNDAPTALTDDFTVGEDVGINGSVFNDNGNGADFDIDSGDSFTLTEVNGNAADVGNQITLASGALLTLNASGTFQYDQNGAFNSLGSGQTGNDSFSYTIEDALGLTSMATVNITINGDTDPPVAQDDTFATDENTAVVDDLFADNGNGIDNDPDGDPIIVSAVEGSGANVGVSSLLASGATVNVASDGTFTYDPGTAFDSLGEGDPDTDTFTYTITDGLGLFDTATVTINLTGLNDGPDARDDAFGLLEDAGLLLDSVFANNGSGADTDPDTTDSFTVTAVNGSMSDVGTQITLASGAIMQINADGTFGYSINGAYDFLSVGDSDTDSFTYTITDGFGLMDTATATFNITGENDDPVANDDSFSVIVTATFNGNVLTGVGSASDDDVDQNDSLSVIDVNGDTGALGTAFALPSGATVNMLSNGTFTYDPSGAGFSAPTMDSFTYGISDGNGGTDTATVNVTIQPPGNAAPVAQDDAFTVQEDGPLFLGTVFADNGSCTDSDPDAGDTFTVTALNGSATDVGTLITLASGALLQLNANGTFDYTDNNAFDSLGDGASDTDTFTYTISDSFGLMDTATVTVTITGVNDAPVALDDGFAMQEDGPLLLGTVFADNGSGADFDPDTGDSFTVTAVNGMPANVGTLITLASGALLQLNADGTFGYTDNGAYDALAEGVIDTDTFTYTISDSFGLMDTATVTVTITGVNDAPVALDDGFAMQEDGPLLLGTVFADNGSGADFDPDTGDSFTVTVVNGMPANVGTLITLASGALLQLNADGTFGYTDNGAFNALGASESAFDTFTYTITDNLGLMDTATVTVTINGVNDAPVFISDNDFTIDENQTFVDTVQAQDDDTNDVLSYAIDNTFGDGALFTIDGTTGDLSFISAPDFENPTDVSGTPGDNIYEVRVEAFDGTATSTQDIMVEVLDVNEGGVTTVTGTPGFDQVVGTALDETIESLGGLIDFSIGGGGVDTFAFGSETTNGMREFDYILDFGTDDFLDLGGASIVQEINLPAQTTLVLDGDGDRIILAGVANFDEANQLV